MKYIGMYSELNLYEDNGSLLDAIQEKPNYNKKIVLRYLSSFKYFAISGRGLKDPITGREISQSFEVYTDGEYQWNSSLIYFVKKYNVELPGEFAERAENGKRSC